MFFEGDENDTKSSATAQPIDKKFATSIVYFYVIPVKVGLIVLTSLVLFILFMRFVIKAYIRRMLLLAGIDPSLNAKERSSLLSEKTSSGMG